MLRVVMSTCLAQVKQSHYSRQRLNITLSNLKFLDQATKYYSSDMSHR